jgi:perosamine synthetase
MPKPLFNSLGSNYSFRFCTVALQQLTQLLIGGSSRRALHTLQGKLETRFAGSAFLLYKGRDAIEFILRAADIGTGDTVITQAFTCHAIEEAITRVGATVAFADLEQHQLNPSPYTLGLAFKKAKRPKAVLIQHTLGAVANMKAIRKWCDEHELLLIEDLAQSFGSCDELGQEVGKYGDAVVCSFGRDKIIDAVSGGAVILKSKKIFKGIRTIDIKHDLAKSIQMRDMLYPMLTWVIRHTHHIGFGKVLFQVGRKTKLLTSPIDSPTHVMTSLPNSYAALALLQLHTLDKQLKHREMVTKVYDNFLNDQKGITEIAIQKGLPLLRFPIRVVHPDLLAQVLTRSQIYVTDRWYRKPVDAGSLPRKSSYVKGSCPNAEKMASSILNLPTHFSISALDAQRIADIIKAQL